MPKRVLSQHFKRDGKPKRPLTEAEARAEEKLCNGAMKAYHCDFCGKWHVGNNK